MKRIVKTFSQWNKLNEKSKIVPINEWYQDLEEYPLMHLLIFIQETNIKNTDDILTFEGKRTKSGGTISDLEEAFYMYARDYPLELGKEPEYYDSNNGQRLKKIVEHFLENMGVNSISELTDNYMLNELDMEGEDVSKEIETYKGFVPYEIPTDELITKYADTLKSEGWKYWDSINMDGYNPVFISKINNRVGNLNFENSIDSLDEILISIISTFRKGWMS